MTFWLPCVITLLALAALAVASALRDRHAAAARRQLGQAGHDQAHRLDQRCDHLQQQIDRLESGQRIEHLGRLVDDGVAGGLLSPPAAARLRAAIRDLASDARQGGR